jgi:TrmH family RNA methyltransferase
MPERIISLQNERVKLTHQLQEKAKLRRTERKIVLEGTRLVGDALAMKQKPMFAFYEPNSVDYGLLARLQDVNTSLFEVSHEVIQHISDTKTPQGMVAVFHLPEPALPKKAERVLILDAVRDPGNMGTILRTAGAAGVQVVILAPDCVDPYNPKVLRAGMGAHFRVPIIEATWKDIRLYCAETKRYLAAGDGKLSYSKVDWTEAWALVIGNEAHGVGEEAEKFQAERVSIPMANAESLNAAVAVGVLLFEAQRQRMSKK